jgi:hypothetical protein
MFPDSSGKCLVERERYVSAYDEIPAKMLAVSPDI